MRLAFSVRPAAARRSTGGLGEPLGEEPPVRDGLQLARLVPPHHGRQAVEARRRVRDARLLRLREVQRIEVRALGARPGAEERLVVQAPVPGPVVDREVAGERVLVGPRVAPDHPGQFLVTWRRLDAEQLVHDLAGGDQVVQHRALGGVQVPEIGREFHADIRLGARGEIGGGLGVGRAHPGAGGFHGGLSFGTVTAARDRQDDDRQNDEHQRTSRRDHDFVSSAGFVRDDGSMSQRQGNSSTIRSGQQKSRQWRDELARQMADNWRERRDSNSRPPA